MVKGHYFLIPAQHAWVRRRARELEITESAIVRDALAAFMARDRGAELTAAGDPPRRGSST
jgi:hypothetical protein